MQRIAVVGPSGSGKTTLARWLHHRLGLPCTDLDDVFWRPGWQPAPIGEFRRAVDRLTRASAWVLAGNYGVARDLIWPRADTLVWLDLPLPRVLWRTTARVVRQARSGESIRNGNRQAIGALFFGKDPLLWYTVRTLPQQRRDWPQVLQAPELRHLSVVRLRSAAQVARWRSELQCGKTPVDK